ncbi:MAG: phosphoenolpyruvate--protein phosphotransferase [Planctomycetota bacterium]
MHELRGIAVSPGVVVGRVYVLDDVRRPVASRTIAAQAIEAEQARFEAAIAASLTELDELRAHAEQKMGTEAADVFAFHQGMLRDRTLIEPIRERIATERISAELAVQERFREVAELFASMPESAFRTKVDDVWDLDHRVLRHLIGEHRREITGAGHDVVVVAAELTPTQTAQFGTDGVVAFATEAGGETSHVAIFARSLSLPAVVGTESIMDIAREGDRIIIDGDEGLVIIRPTDEIVERYHGIAARAAELRARLGELREEPAITTDGERIELLGNIELAGEMHHVIEHGAEGVGLFRTEFLWLTSDHEPSEDEQFEALRAAVEAADGRPVTIRTFDLGADKYTQRRAMMPERNPFLGNRSLRYCLTNLTMFKQHLRAVLRASALGEMKIMFPLVTSLSEFRQAKLIVHEVMEDLEEDGLAFDRRVPLGMMVEVPSAAVMAPVYAGEADFFSIGTNDLIQYTLAVDRTNERVAHLYSAADPAVLRLIKEVVRAGRRSGVPVSCCGEVAGDPVFTMLLIGLGLRTLSATPSRLPFVKRVIRSVDVKSCERLARRVGSLDSERQVSALLRDQARKRFPELFDGRSVDASG